MARKKQRTNWKLSLKFDELQSLAPKILAASRFSMLFGDDCELQKSSGIWAKANGTFTARLVYRTPVSNSLVLTVNIRRSMIKPDAPVVVNG